MTDAPSPSVLAPLERLVVKWRSQGPTIYRYCAEELEAVLAALGEPQEQLQRLIKAASCQHDNRTGGNDYILCPNCNLMWDYRRETANDALVRELKSLGLSGPAPQKPAVTPEGTEP